MKKNLYLLVLVAAFLFVSFKNFDKHPVGWDETILTSPSISMLLNRPIHPQFVTFNFCGRQWPVLEATYGIGSIEAYLMLPIYKIFGVSIYTLRSSGIILTAAALLLFSYSAYFMFGSTTFYIAAPLLFLNSTILIQGKSGFNGINLVQWLLLSTSLLFLSKWFLARRKTFLYTSAFFLGAGMYAKLYFLGIVAGFWIGWLLLLKGGAVDENKTSPAVAGDKALSFKMAFFMLAGFSPYLIWNIFHHWESLKQLFSLFVHPMESASNKFYLDTLMIRYSQLKNFIVGSQGLYLYKGPLWLSVIKLAPFLLLFSLLFPGLLSRAEKMKLKIPLLFLLLMIAFFMFSVSFRGTMITNPDNDHVLPIFPLAIICSAVILRILLSNKAFLAIFVPVLLIPNLFVMMDYNKAFSSHKGKYPDEELCNYLLENKFYETAVINSHDIGPDIEILSRGLVAVTPAWWFGPQEFQQKCNNWMDQESLVYIVSAKKKNDICNREDQSVAFYKMANENRKKVKVIKEFIFDQSDRVLVCKLEDLNV